MEIKMGRDSFLVITILGAEHEPARCGGGFALCGLDSLFHVGLALSAFHVPVSRGVLALLSLDRAQDLEQVKGARTSMTNAGWRGRAQLIENMNQVAFYHHDAYNLMHAHHRHP